MIKKALLMMLMVQLLPSLYGYGTGENHERSSVLEGPVEQAALNYFSHFKESNIIREDAFVTLVQRGESMFIVDLRKAEDYDKGHVRGAVNIPWGITLSEAVEYIPQTGQVFVYCYSGQVASQATMLMNMAGIPARSVRYGFVRGIRSVEGFESTLVSQSAPLPKNKQTIDPLMKKAFETYFSDLGEPPFANNIVSASDAVALLASGDSQVVFLDVRRYEDFAESHVPGAISLPFESGMEEKFERIPSGRLVVVYCYSGQSSGQVVAALKVLGHRAVSVNSGIGTYKTGSKGWSNEGFPLES